MIKYKVNEYPDLGLVKGLPTISMSELVTSPICGKLIALVDSEDNIVSTYILSNNFMSCVHQNTIVQVNQE